MYSKCHSSKNLLLVDAIQALILLVSRHIFFGPKQNLLIMSTNCTFLSTHILIVIGRKLCIYEYEHNIMSSVIPRNGIVIIF
jgi:hypothetical protein